jgi:2-amino-4-hydroxy-6-hydroxymethyldihydropteridine diphosphokinase
VIALPDDALVIGLGGNVGGEPAVIERFRRAREALAQLGEVRSASLYRTAWVGPAQGAGPTASMTRGGPVQPAFLNTVVRVRYSDGTPHEVISTLLELERLLGRDRRGEARNGPRAIDLDALLWGTRVVRTRELEVPHPRLVERRFALQPTAELFGEDLALAGTTIGALLRRVSAQACEQIAASW